MSAIITKRVKWSVFHGLTFVVSASERKIPCMIRKILVTNWPSLQGMPVVSSLLFLLSIHTADFCQVIKPIKQHELIGHVMKAMQETSFEICTYRCELDVKCYSVNFHTKTGRCEFNYGSKEMFPQDFKESRDTLYIHNIRKDMKDPCRLLYCLHGGSCYPLPQPYCVCTVDFTGSRCQNITLPLKAVGIEDDNKIFDGQLTSSTSPVGHEAWRGRLHGPGSWKPVTGDLAPNFNISLFSPVNVTYIATQGSPTEDCWTTTFRIYYKMQGGSLKQYPEIIAGNTDRDTVIYHPLKPALVQIEFLSIQPYSSNRCIGLRVELYE
ncbi:uncharacterized protein LOC110040383 isoform X1 [Orbicella faveolata]|uniref:uncharacterized protein LOC110040383 isoform X1 n=2 Tax=Orbicella faveolata TaxID=48498 RepID=UPI0009E3278B|nr:uncharacterized protein LOC110040383 isoform X1 [Orbicella faveolata]